MLLAAFEKVVRQYSIMTTMNEKNICSLENEDERTILKGNSKLEPQNLNAINSNI